MPEAAPIWEGGSGDAGDDLLMHKDKGVYGERGNGSHAKTRGRNLTTRKAEKK